MLRSQPHRPCREPGGAGVMQIFAKIKKIVEFVAEVFKLPVKNGKA
jgi:hypothetical protein